MPSAESTSIYLGGAGGAPTNNVISSLRASGSERLIGGCSNPADLMLADVDERYVMPTSDTPGYKEKILALLAHTRPTLAHFQHDFEIRTVSGFRQDVTDLGIKLYMPSHRVIEDCVDKNASYRLWAAAGIRVPQTFLINDTADLKKAFEILGDKLWLRAIEGGGGKGALPADSYDFAKLWIDRFKGWGVFTAAELLSPDTVTWLSIWHEGELVVAQTRKRGGWGFGDRTLSGVTGVTALGATASDETVDRVAQDAILAIDPRPHGIYGVDMTYDKTGFPNPTEINISRFFTTVHFFTVAGVNFPRIFADIALHGKFPNLAKRINPLPDGLIWIRGMDRPPVLMKADEFKAFQAAQAYV